MSAVVKYPSSAADAPDKRFCGQCGRLCQPLINNNIGFGPCIEAAPNVLECNSLRAAIVGSFTIAAQLGRPVHPDTAALVARLGIPDALVKRWVDKETRAQAIRAELRESRYDENSPLSQIMRWIDLGDTDERIIALLDELKVSLDPTEGVTQEVTMGQIADWHQHVAKRASDILSDPGEWEIGE